MDLFILEPITQELARDVIKDVHGAKGEDITAHIMTMGGDMLAGNAIASVLRNSTSHITTNVVGVAASMGAVISQAGDKRLIAPDASFNIHNGAMGYVGRGTKEEHVEAAETLDKFDESMIGAFSKTGLSREDISIIMKADKLLTADEALTLGFFDGLSKPIKAVAELNLNTDMSVISELLAKADVAAIKMGLKSTDDEAKKALVAALEKELKGQVEEQVMEVAATEETGADILSSEMVPREEFELFKAEVLALIQPLLGAVETLPTPEETAVVVEETTTAKLDSLLRAIKSKTAVPVGKQSFEQPEAKQPEDWSVYEAKKKKIKETNNR